MKNKVIVISLAFWVALGVEAALAGNRLVVFGVDESGSYGLRQQGLG